MLNLNNQESNDKSDILGSKHSSDKCITSNS